MAMRKKTKFACGERETRVGMSNEWSTLTSSRRTKGIANAHRNAGSRGDQQLEENDGGFGQRIISGVMNAAPDRLK